jgi:hypothetical protein
MRALPIGPGDRELPERRASAAPPRRRAGHWIDNRTCTCVAAAGTTSFDGGFVLANPITICCP